MCISNRELPYQCNRCLPKRFLRKRGKVFFHFNGCIKKNVKDFQILYHQIYHYYIVNYYI